MILSEKSIKHTFGILCSIYFLVSCQVSNQPFNQPSRSDSHLDLPFIHRVLFGSEKFLSQGFTSDPTTTTTTMTMTTTTSTTTATTTTMTTASTRLQSRDDKSSSKSDQSLERKFRPLLKNCLNGPFAFFGAIWISLLLFLSSQRKTQTSKASLTRLPDESLR